MTRPLPPILRRADGKARLELTWLTSERDRWPDDLSRRLRALMIVHGCWAYRQADAGPDGPFGIILQHFKEMFEPGTFAGEGGGTREQRLINRVRNKINRTRVRMIAKGHLANVGDGFRLSLPASGTMAGATGEEGEDSSSMLMDDSRTMTLDWVRECSVPEMEMLLRTIFQRVGPPLFVGLLSRVWAPLAPGGVDEMGGDDPSDAESRRGWEHERREERDERDD